MPESFGEYVRRHRTGLQMNQETLARKAEISQAYVSGIERGINQDVDAKIVRAIADALGRSQQESLSIAFPGVISEENTKEIRFVDGRFRLLWSESKNIADEDKRFLEALLVNWVEHVESKESAKEKAAKHP